jgi:hypothetical protein
MKIVSFVNPCRRDVIDRILAHGELSSQVLPSEAKK